MRSLTLAEARVTGALLATVPGDEVDRAQRSGVPRTTFQTVRRRLFVAGWLYLRYLPSLAAAHARSVTIRLAQPYAERRAAIVRHWRSDPDTVVLWASPETVLCVTFDREPEDGRTPTGARAPAGIASLPVEWFRRVWTMSPGPGAANLPAYFDYEGAWSRRLGADPPISYPQGLPPGGDGSVASRGRDLSLLLRRPFEGGLSEGGVLRFSASFLSRRERRLVRDGWVTRRVLPDLAELPEFRGQRIDRVVFITGTLRDGASFPSLRAELHRECGVAPFLAAHDGGRVLLAMLSPAPASARTSRPVLATLEASLREIEVVREPTDTLYPLIDHRYDRLVSVADRPDGGIGT